MNAVDSVVSNAIAFEIDVKRAVEQFVANIVGHFVKSETE